MLGQRADPEDERAAVKHFLAVLANRYPGKSVEVRIPPYAAVQCIEGARHTRGTPPAVVETDAVTWVALARGTLEFAAAAHDGRVSASGERSNLSGLLPLPDRAPAPAEVARGQARAAARASPARTITMPIASATVEESSAHSPISTRPTTSTKSDHCRRCGGSATRQR